MNLWRALIVLCTAAVPAFAQTDTDTNGTGLSHGFSVSDGDTVKFGRQSVRLFGIITLRPWRGSMGRLRPSMVCLRSITG